MHHIGRLVYRFVLFIAELYLRNKHVIMNHKMSAAKKDKLYKITIKTVKTVKTIKTIKTVKTVKTIKPSRPSRLSRP